MLTVKTNINFRNQCEVIHILKNGFSQSYNAKKDLYNTMQHLLCDSVTEINHSYNIVFSECVRSSILLTSLCKDMTLTLVCKKYLDLKIVY